MTIMTSYFRIRDNVITIFKFHKISTHCIFLPSSARSDLNNQKKIEKFASLIMNDLCVNFLILEDDIYNGLRSHKVS